MNDNAGTRVSCFLVGFGIGAVLTVLFAPKSGEDTRAYLIQKGEEGKAYMQDQARAVRERAEDLVERGKEISAEQKERISGAVDAGRETYRRVKSEPL